MKSFFNYDSPFFQFLNRVADLIIVNVLFLVCCVPLITVGASLAGLTKVTQNIALNAEGGVVKTFFRAFRDDFKQATAVWLVMAAFLAALFCDRILVDGYLTGGPAAALRGLLLALALACLAVACYLYPLLVRYDNTLKQHILNAILLAVSKLPRTALMTAAGALPFVLCYFAPAAFLKSLAFWAIIGCGFISCIQSYLMSPVLAQLENRDPHAAEETES